MNGELVVVDDVPAEFATRVVDAFASRPGRWFSLVMSGGDTAMACYEALAASRAGIDWRAVDVFWGDERCVPADHDDSNQRMGRVALLDKVGPLHSVHPMVCESGPQPYADSLAAAGRLDLVHLGLGPDGHTASLFPGSSGLEAAPGQLVCLNEDPNGRNQHPRMTLTYSGIALARLVLVTVRGASKRSALNAVIGGADLPGARIYAERGSLAGRPRGNGRDLSRCAKT